MANAPASACSRIEKRIEESVVAKARDIAKSEAGKLFSYSQRGRVSRLLPKDGDHDSTAWRDLDQQILYSLKRLRGAGAENAADSLYLYVALANEEGLAGKRTPLDADALAVVSRVTQVCYEIGMMKRCAALLDDLFKGDPDYDMLLNKRAACRKRLREWGFLRR